MCPMKRSETRKGPIWVALLHLSQVKPWNVERPEAKSRVGLAAIHHTRWVDRWGGSSGSPSGCVFVSSVNKSSYVVIVVNII